MKRSILVPTLLAFSILVSLIPGTSPAAVPLYLNHQGYLTDIDNFPLSGPFQVTFTICGDEACTNRLWSEVHSLQVENGIFSVNLGGIEPLDPSLFGTSPRYLEVQVAGYPPMSPNQMITSVPYAFASAQCDSATVASSVTNLCETGDFRYCYPPADPAQINVGQCKPGIRMCNQTGTGYGPCVGWVGPDPAGEICFDGIDNNCDGYMEENCGIEAPCTQQDRTLIDECNNGCWGMPLDDFQMCTNECLGALNSNECLEAVQMFFMCATFSGQCDPEIMDYADYQTCAMEACPEQYNTAFVGAQPECTFGQTRPCGSDVGVCQQGTQTCSVEGLWSGACVGAIFPEQEICDDGLDNDCDGQTDELEVIWCVDNDGDGVPENNCVPGCEFQPPDGYNMMTDSIPTQFDCDDGDPEIFPGMPELCDGKDNDCDGEVDGSNCDPVYCYDEICGPGENIDNCPADCSFCGDDICSGQEDQFNCLQDCPPVCGDGICNDSGGETNATCDNDCPPVCGDGYCHPVEDPYSCPADCGFADGTPCNDGDACTENDVYISNVCMGTGMSCDDGNPCTWETCDPGSGCQYPPANQGVVCNDGNPNTFNDVCDGAGNCVGIANGTPCDDGDACTMDDAYTAGLCVGTPMTCDDGLICTNDICVDGTCTFSIIDDWCLIDGACYSSGTTSPGNLCLYCDASVNPDSWSNTPDGSWCDDGIFCTGADTCSSGVCVGTGDPCPGPDGDSDCAESCNEAAGDCTGNDPNGSSCDDGNPSTSGDVCDGNGVCSGF